MIESRHHYHRLSGNGNDFLAFAEPERRPTPHQIRTWCRRGVGLGADGVFVLERVGGPEGQDARVRMTHFNPDGGEAGLCLNGVRCAARLAFALAWARDVVRIETGAGTQTARMSSEGSIAVEVPAPAAPRREVVEVEGQAAPLTVWAVEVGVPHVVLEWPASLQHLDPRTLGPALRHHERFAPAGANVDFVRFPAPHLLEVRTWERGVEGETLACGTGILAAVRVGIACERLELPVEVGTCGGFPTRVELGPGSNGAPSWSLVSDARLLAEGWVADEADIAAPAVRWTP